MSLKVLAKRSGLSLRTVQRVFSSGEPNARLDSVLQIANALNVELRFKEAGSAHSFRKRAATEKAARLASMVQATSALESQAIPNSDLRDIEADIAARLLTGSSRQLWAD